eukprot:GFKZ01006363.1.p1 GENE.GFKZ01006363.1~~GFKZ01006363.1.p1  ORF type:complete len:458 (-),score=49.96 GFKZ01006363.1:1465-2838(-)
MHTENDVGHETEASILLSTTPSPPPQARPFLRHLLISILLFGTAVAMTIPVRPKLILDASNSDATLASIFTSIVDSLQSLVAIFSSPLFGAVSDVIGRKPIFLASHLGEFVALFLIFKFPMSLMVQLPAYILIALTNAYYTTASTMIADISIYQGGTSQEGSVVSARNYGLVGAGIGFCFLLGPALGGFIEDRFYVASSFLVACCMILAAMVYVWAFLPETKPGEEEDTENGQEGSNWERGWNTVARMGRAIRQTEINPFPRVNRIFGGNEALQWFAAAIAASSLAQGGLNSIIFLYVKVRLGWDTKETGFFLSMVGLSMLISQGILAPAAVKVFGETETILLGYSLSAVHYFLYGVAKTGAIMYLGLFVGMFAFTAEPALKGLLARQVGIETQGSLQGSLSALTSVVRPLSPIISGALFGYGNQIGQPGLPFIVMAATATLAVGLARVAFWKPGFK